MHRADRECAGAKRKSVPTLPFPSRPIIPRKQGSCDSWVEMDPPQPPPFGGRLSSSNGGDFQHPSPLPRAHPTPVSLPIAEIGVGTTGFGIFFILFGILLYFDSVLLAFGNVSRLACVPSATNLPEVSIARKVSPEFNQIVPLQGSGPSSLGQ